MVTDSKILITDVSHLPRFGIKGREAFAWLSLQKVTLPTIANSWVIGESLSLILRLGNSEFLVEDQKNDQTTTQLHTSSKNRTTGLYPVARADASFVLAGESVMDLLSEICMLDLSEEPYPQALYMTQIAGISATLLQQKIEGKAIVRLWCDGTYRHYMHETLNTIAKDICTSKSGLI
jgi:sarcosine oxidase subunit gamma